MGRCVLLWVPVGRPGYKMPETATYQQAFYRGTFEHGVDDKRRVQLPAKWRPPADDWELTLIPWPYGGQQDVFLMVLPPKEYAALAAKIEAMGSGDPRAEALRNLLGAEAEGVTQDKAGRICIPDKLATRAGIDKKALLVGAVHRFQIWAPERYEASKAARNAILNEAFQLI